MTGYRQRINSAPYEFGRSFDIISIDTYISILCFADMAEAQSAARLKMFPGGIFMTAENIDYAKMIWK